MSAPHHPQASVVGLGNWGTALANHLACKGLEVLGWAIEPEIVSGINENHHNPTYLKDVALSPNLKATGRLEEALSAPIVVLVVPSKVLAKVVPGLALRSDQILVSAVKGIEPSAVQTPLQFAAARLPAPCRLAVLSGPSFARDVVLQRPCGIVAAAQDEATARAVAELFTGNSMKVYISTDPLGVELGGITKNVIAVAVGVSDGLNLGDSARAGLITRGLAEMTRLAEAMGADVRTLAGLSGLGDLAMTSTSDLSRNRTVGVRLGKGEKLSDIVASLGSVAEGVTTTPLVLDLASRFKVEMPITQQVAALIRGEVTPAEAVRNLISRPMRREVD